MALLAVLLLVLIAAPPALAGPGLDHVASEHVTLVQNVRLPGAGQGGALSGNRLYTSSPSHLAIFDVTDPETPRLLGAAPLEAANETERIATNDRIAALATADGVAIYDVRNPAAIRLIAETPLDAIGVACVDDCRYLWVVGDDVILDLSDPARPRAVGSFESATADRDGVCYSARELRPGVIILACDPLMVVSTRAEDGGRPEQPVVIAAGDAPDPPSGPLGAIPHSARWPRGGTDAILLSSTETPFRPDCSDVGALVTYDARRRPFRALSEWRPANGSYFDGRSPYNAVGCSPHFLTEHPTFRDGGLVAQAALENGVRLLQIRPDGGIEERHFFLGAGGAAAVPIWHPDGRTLYVVDYLRGLDVLRYTGDRYLPPPPAVAPDPGPPAAAAPPAPARMRILGVVARRRGSATLAVEVPSAGRVVARSTARVGHRTLRLPTVGAEVVQAGLVTLRIGATGRALRVLRRQGRLRVDVRIHQHHRTLATRITLRR